MRTRCASCWVISLLFVAACGAPENPRFGPETPLSSATALGAAPMFAVSPRGDDAAAWVSAPDGGTDGRVYVSVNGGVPAMLRDPLGPIEPHGESPPKLAYGSDGSLYALYVVVKLVPGRRFPAAAMRFARSLDGGRTWDAPATVTDDSVFGSHNFHALHVAPDGSVYVSWLDGREGKSAVYLTRSTDGGKTWERNHRVSVGEACPCCRTAMATSRDGVMYLAWRTVMPGNVRDVVVARSTDHGATWGEPHRVHEDNWVFDGCPHAGPSLQVDARGRLHVAWWTGKEGAAGVWYTHSDDGEHFAAATALGVADFSTPAHVQLALAGDSGVIATWDDGTARRPRIVTRYSRDAGASFGASQMLSADGSVGSFPVVAVRGDSITVAWTSTPDAPQAAAAAHAAHTPRDKTTPQPLPKVGDARVVVRRGRLVSGS
jgi:hypothetical protein